MANYALTLMMRDAIKLMVDTELRKRNLTPSYGTVKGTVDHQLNKVFVLMNGQTDLVANYISVSINTLHPTSSGDRVRVEGQGTDQYIAEVVSPQKTYLYAATLDLSGGIVADGLATTTAPANVNHDAGTGVLARVTSLAEDKLLRHRIEADYSFLDIPTYTWTDRSQHVLNPQTKNRYAGGLAEDVIIYPGLAEYHRGEIRGTFYDRWIAYLLPVVRDMNHRIEDLEKRITELEEQLT